MKKIMTIAFAFLFALGFFWFVTWEALEAVAAVTADGRGAGAAFHFFEAALNTLVGIVAINGAAWVALLVYLLVGDISKSLEEERRNEITGLD